MSLIRSRSRLLRNAAEFRHPLMFEGRTDFNPEKPLDQFRGKLHRKTKESLDCVWYLRKEYDAGDDDQVADLMAVSVVDWDKMIEEYQRTKHAAPQLREDIRTTAETAWLCQMTIALEGECFRFPADFSMEDWTGSGDESEAEQPHPFAGTMMRPTPECISRLDPVLRAEAYRFVIALRGQRSASEQKAFRTETVAVDDAAEDADAGGTPGA